MERKGELLESGIFGDNYYGTPKPPKDPSKLKLQHQSNSLDENRGSDTSLKREQSHTNNNDVDRAPGMGRLKQQSGLSKSYHAALHVDSLGPLPDNWEIAYTEENEKYFIE